LEEKAKLIEESAKKQELQIHELEENIKLEEREKALEKLLPVQEKDFYGILKAIGVKTSSLFKMMWTQMLFITVIALGFSVALSQAFTMIAPEGMPFSLTAETTIQLSIVFLVIGFIGATLSGIQIKKVEPLQAIQQGEV